MDPTKIQIANSSSSNLDPAQISTPSFGCVREEAKGSLAFSGPCEATLAFQNFENCLDEVVSFPLYVEAIRFAFHEESMIRTAVRALTLNVYHVGDDAVNRFVSRAPHADYFLNLVNFFRDQCIHLNLVISNASKNLSMESPSSILSAVDEIEDNLYYFSDVVSAGIPDVGRLIMDNVLRLLIFPLILPSLRTEVVKEPSLGAVTSLYLLCCILRIVKIKDLANIVAAALLCCPETFTWNYEDKLNGNMLGHGSLDAVNKSTYENNHNSESEAGRLQVTIPTSNSSPDHPPHGVLGHDCSGTQFVPRDALLSFVTSGDDVQVSGSLNVLATLLQTKELDESTVDALGILPQRKQHKKKLLQALVGEDSGDEQLFSSGSSEVIDGDDISSELDIYLKKLKEYVGVSCASPEVGASPRVHRFQVLDALVSLFCRSNISAETLWDGGWLLRQLLPYSEAEFNSHHLRLLKESFHHCTSRVVEETRGPWSDLLVTVICDEWRKCKRAIEAASPRKDPRCMLLPPYKSTSDEHPSSESSIAAGERMCETVKVFALLHHLHVFSLGRVLPDQPPVLSATDLPEKSRAKNAGVKPPGLKPNAEVTLVDGLPCRIAFERGKERHFQFLALSTGSSGWLVLAEELPMKPQHGLVRVIAPLAGCNPRIDDKHSRWLHLRIRPSSFPFADTANYTARGKVKSKALVDGRWTLAFRDEESCKNAMSMILEELKLQSDEVERILQPLLELERSLDESRLSKFVEDNSS
ncbi:protein clec16a homolog [Phtheirospermum japonicum]|uniref:Protein clec16a homolog n=1 Tax=Phtheirospermum japonicum TaxID=374723 RepID=A0A830BK35_9LAMI|nr:protein clec16a homolog [Phtheirospermum japonicum]